MLLGGSSSPTNEQPQQRDNDDHDRQFRDERDRRSDHGHDDDHGNHAEYCHDTNFHVHPSVVLDASTGPRVTYSRRPTPGTQRSFATHRWRRDGELDPEDRDRATPPRA